MVTDLDLKDIFKVLQATFWAAAFFITVVMVGLPHWKRSRAFLKANVAGWTAATGAMFLSTVSLTAEQLFPDGFSWWCGITPILMCVTATSILWYCHLALSELNTKNNRRSSGLIDRSIKP